MKSIKRNEPTDPPMKPARASTRWFESGPEPIIDDPETAIQIARIGTAANALSAQLHAIKDARRRRGSAAIKQRDIISAIVTSTAIIFESIRLASSAMPILRRLAKRGGAPKQVLKRMGTLCAGKHPASAVMDRARNQLGFHWDGDVIGPATRAFASNKAIVWVESDKHFNPVHGFALAVLLHALFPEGELSDGRDEDIAEPAMKASIANINDAMLLIIEFFTASVYGYVAENGIRRRERKPRRA